MFMMKWLMLSPFSVEGMELNLNNIFCNINLVCLKKD